MALRQEPEEVGGVTPAPPGDRGGPDDPLDLPSLENIPTTPGARITAMAGVTEDLEVKEIPGTLCDIEVPTVAATATMTNILEITSILGGEQITSVWSKPDTIAYRFTFPNVAQAKQASKMIIENVDSKAKCAISESSSYTTTSQGNLLLLGDAADELGEFGLNLTAPGQITTMGNGKPVKREPANAIQVSTEIKEMPSRISLESQKHAETIEPPSPEIQGIGTMLIIHLPNELNPTDRLEKAAELIERLEANGNTYVQIEGNIISMFIAEERSAGNTLRRLEGMQREIKKDGIRMIFTHGQYNVATLGSDSTTLQAGSSEIFEEIAAYKHQTPPPGIWMNHAFETASQHERNLSAAVYRRNGNYHTIRQGKLKEIDNIESNEFKKPMDLSRITVGREDEIKTAIAKLDSAVTHKHTEFITITGQAGIGKTNMAVRLHEEAEKGKYGTLYYKCPESGSTNHANAIKRIIRGLLMQTDSKTRKEFSDLVYYISDNVPQGKEKRYGGQVRTLNNSARFVSKRLNVLLTRSVKLATLDDLQWADEFSLSVLVESVKTLPKKAGVLINFLGRSGEQPLPHELMEAIGSRGDQHTNIKLTQLANEERIKHKLTVERATTHTTTYTESELTAKTKSKQRGLIRQCIKAHLSGTMAICTIPDGFVDQMHKISHGIPLIIAEVLSSLKYERQISINGGVLETPSAEKMTKLVKENPFDTLTSVIQAKFGRLNQDELQIVDYMVALGESDIIVFRSMLKYLGHDPAAVDMLIGQLVTKEIITKSPFRFYYDQMELERKKHLKSRGDLSRRAADCYGPLKRQKGKHPAITAPYLFKMLTQALADTEQLEDGEAKKLERDIPRLGREAIDHCLAKSQNLQALEIVGVLERPLAKLRAAARNPKATIKQKRQVGKYLYEMYMLAAETLLRVSKTPEAKAYLDQIETLSTELPSASVLPAKIMINETAVYDEATTVRGLRFRIERIKAAFFERKGHEVDVERIQLKTMLTALTLKESSLKDHPEVILAEGEVMLAKVRAAGVSKNEEDLNRLATSEEMTTALGKITRLQRNKDPKIAKRAKALRIEILRHEAQMEGYFLFKSMYGIDAEALWMQEITTSDVRKLVALIRKIQIFANQYENNPSLIQDPETYGNLETTLTKAYGLLANSNHNPADNLAEAQAHFEKAIRITINWDTPNANAATQMVMGDMIVGRTLRKRVVPVDEDQWPATWDTKELDEAIDHYRLGYAEMARVGAQDSYHAFGCMIHAAQTIAMRILAKPEEATKELFKEAWGYLIGPLETLNKWANDNPSNPEYRKMYLKEVTTMGLLMRAATMIVQIKPVVPPYIKTADIGAASMCNITDAESAKNGTDADKKLQRLRTLGNNGWGPFISANAAAYADTETQVNEETK